jgi:hypothetical protein
MLVIWVEKCEKKLEWVKKVKKECMPHWGRYTPPLIPIGIGLEWQNPDGISGLRFHFFWCILHYNLQFRLFFLLLFAPESMDSTWTGMIGFQMEWPECPKKEIRYYLMSVLTFTYHTSWAHKHHTPQSHKHHTSRHRHTNITCHPSQSQSHMWPFTKKIIYHLIFFRASATHHTLHSHTSHSHTVTHYTVTASPVTPSKKGNYVSSDAHFPGYFTCHISQSHITQWNITHSHTKNHDKSEKIMINQYKSVKIRINQ